VKTPLKERNRASPIQEGVSDSEVRLGVTMMNSPMLQHGKYRRWKSHILLKEELKFEEVELKVSSYK
jgi:hypothetical protein